MVTYFQSNFDDKHFCTLLAGVYTHCYSTFVPFLSQWIEIEINYIFIVYRRAIMFGYSENTNNFPDQF